MIRQPVVRGSPFRQGSYQSGDGRGDPNPSRTGSLRPRTSGLTCRPGRPALRRWISHFTGCQQGIRVVNVL